MKVHDASLIFANNLGIHANSFLKITTLQNNVKFSTLNPNSTNSEQTLWEFHISNVNQKQLEFYIETFVGKLLCNFYNVFYFYIFINDIVLYSQIYWAHFDVRRTLGVLSAIRVVRHRPTMSRVVTLGSVIQTDPCSLKMQKLL